MKIRIATIKDAENIRNIYAPYVLNTAVSFEYELPDTKEFTNRIESTLKNYPYLVAMVNDDVVGYAYASAFHSRAAYRHSANGMILSGWTRSYRIFLISLRILFHLAS